ncbi:unnamed protein product [Rhodiola kirilowii]
MADSSFFDPMDFIKRPSIYEAFVDILLCAVPIWVAVVIGMVIGWSWRPRWTENMFLGLRIRFRPRHLGSVRGAVAGDHGSFSFFQRRGLVLERRRNRPPQVIGRRWNQSLGDQCD